MDDESSGVLGQNLFFKEVLPDLMTLQQQPVHTDSDRGDVSQRMLRGSDSDILINVMQI